MAYARVYSTRIIAKRGLNGDQPVVIPANTVAVLRDVDVYYGGSLGGTRFWLIGTDNQAIWEYTSRNSEGEAFQWRGRQVFNAGETILFRSEDVMDVTASGYFLTEQP